MGITLPYDIVPPKYGPAARYTWTTLKARSLFFVVLYCSSSEPVHGRLTSEQSVSAVLLLADQISSWVMTLSVLHLLAV